MRCSASDAGFMSDGVRLKVTPSAAFRCSIVVLPRDRYRGTLATPSRSPNTIAGLKYPILGHGCNHCCNIGREPCPHRATENHVVLGASPASLLDRGRLWNFRSMAGPQAWWSEPWNLCDLEQRSSSVRSFRECVPPWRYRRVRRINPGGFCCLCSARAGHHRVFRDLKSIGPVPAPEDPSSHKGRRQCAKH